MECTERSESRTGRAVLCLLHLHGDHGPPLHAARDVIDVQLHIIEAEMLLDYAELGLHLCGFPSHIYAIDRLLCPIRPKT